MRLFKLLKSTLSHYLSGGYGVFAAGIAYYTLFALTPIILVLLYFSSIWLSTTPISQSIYSQMSQTVSPGAARFIQEAAINLADFSGGPLAVTFSVLAVVWAATGLFNHLSRAFNAVMEAEGTQKRGFEEYVSTRLLAILLILLFAVLLTLSLALGTVIQAIGSSLPLFWGLTPVALEWINFLISLAILVLLFTLLYKALPVTAISSTHAFWGGLTAAVLFMAGKQLFSWYIGFSSLGSVYGTAGSVLVLLVWIYVSAHFLLLGAQLISELEKRVEYSGEKALSMNASLFKSKEYKIGVLVSAAVVAGIEWLRWQWEKE